MLNLKWQRSSFVTEDGYRGVEKYTFKVFGITMKEDELQILVRKAHSFRGGMDSTFIL